MVATDTEWADRIGADATQQLVRATTIRRFGGTTTLLSVALGIASQLYHYYRPGIYTSAALYVGGMLLTFCSLKYNAKARRIVAARVGLPPGQARYVPVRRGIAAYDRWYAARGKPDWPRKGWL